MKKLLLIIFIPFLIFGQENDVINNHIKLEPINIYGSLIDLNKFESGKHITIINSAQIENYSFHSIDGLLKLIPSIELQSRGGFGTQSDIVLRGTTFNQTLVLLDGVRINDPLTGHFSMYIPISAFEIHQIEIIRGGGSSIYGPDAVGGVINIVTKSFKDSINNNELIAESKLGAYKLKGLNFYLARNLNNKLFSTLSVDAISADGQELYDDIFSFFDNQNFSVSHRYTPNNKLSFILRSAYSKNYFNSQYYYTRSDFDLSTELIEKVWTQFKVNYNINDNSNLNFHTAYQAVSDLYVFNPDFPVYQNYTELLNNKINYIKKTEDYRLVSGLEFQNRKITSIDRGNHTDYYLGGFINFIKTFSAISLNPSLRLDYNRSYGIQFCPQIDVNYNHTNYNIRANFGRTIRSADFTERFYNNNYTGALSSGRNIGNPDLNVEKSINYELGFDYKKYKNIIFNNTLFYRKSSDLIDWVLLNSDQISTEVTLLENENYLFAQNISNLNTFGLESEMWFNLMNNDILNIHGSIGYLKIFSAEKIKDMFNPNYTLSSKYLANNSGDRLNYNLFVNWKQLKLNVNGVLKLRNNELDLTINQSLSQSYFIHNCNINYQLNTSVSFGFEVINILNTSYSDILGAIMPSRWCILNIKYVFR